MSAALSVLVFIAALLWGPQLIEGSSNSCSALASRAVSVTIQNYPAEEKQGDEEFGGLIRTVGGEIAKDYAAKEYPNIPVGVTCAGIYWHALIYPRSLENIIDQLPASWGSDE